MKLSEKHKATLLIATGVLIPIIHYGAVMLDARTGWIGGGPGDANIGLGILGLLVAWPAGLILLSAGTHKLIMARKH